MIVGITSRYSDLKSYHVYKRYVDYLRQFDVSCILLLPGNINNKILKLCDIFLLSGGDDIDPTLYAESNISCNNVDVESDLFDIEILDYAVKNDKKVLGICKGMQLINVYFNGTLNQNIENHSSGVKHYINYLDKKYLVNSYHHQSVNKPGDDLIVLARSEDFSIEIIRHKKFKVLGIQSHPELEEDKNIQQLFHKLICENIIIN